MTDCPKCKELNKSCIQIEGEAYHRVIEAEAKLYHAWNTIRSQQKGMKRMARRMKRNSSEGSKEQRTENTLLIKKNLALHSMLAWLDSKGGLGGDVHTRIRDTLDYTGEDK